jgi:superkiller protein 3
VTASDESKAKARSLGKSGQSSEALKAWREVATVERTPQVQYELGRAALRAGEKEEGVSILIRVTEETPNFADAHFALGFFCESENRLEEALGHLREGLKITEWQPAQTMLGEVLRRLGDTQGAEKAFERALELDGDDDEAMYGLALVWRYTDAGKATNLLRKAIKLNPSNARSHAELGHMLLQQGDFAQAEATLRTAVALDGQDAWAHDYLGHALTFLQRYDEAEEAFRAAVTLWPAQALFHCNLGDALLRQDRFVEAEVAYQQALQIDVSYYLANLRYGQLLKDRGQFRKAKVYLKRAIASDPSDSRARDALAAMQ